MKKFLTLLSATLISVASFATVVSADPMTTDIIKPEFVLEISSVDGGYAVADVVVEVETEASLTKSGPRYTGYAITDIQGNFVFDGEIFAIAKPAEDAIPEPGKANVVYNPVENIFNAANTWGGNVNNVIQTADKRVVLGCVWLPLSDAYASMTAEELNALDFATISYAEIIVGQWANGTGTTLATQTTYRTTDTGDFIAGTRVGAEKLPDPEPPVDEKDYGKAGNDFEGKKSKYWTVDFAEWTGTADVSLTDGTRTETINVTTAEGSEDYVIGGAVSFYVYVIGNDIANVYIVE